MKSLQRFGHSVFRSAYEAKIFTWRNNGADRWLSSLRILAAVIVGSPDNDVVLRRATETLWNRNQHHSHRILVIETSVVLATLPPSLSPARYHAVLNVSTLSVLSHARNPYC